MDILSNTGIKSVRLYTASPVECCDRCSQGIKYVALVTYKDGFVAKYGMDCINRVLGEAPTMKSLFSKNAKLLKRYQEALAILSGKPEDMPKGSEYFGAGFGFIADSKGRDINGGKSGHSFFHPLINWERNQDPNRRTFNNSTGRYERNYVQKSLAEYQSKCYQTIEQEKPWFAAEIVRLEGFLARILDKVNADQRLDRDYAQTFFDNRTEPCSI